MYFCDSEMINFQALRDFKRHSRVLGTLRYNGVFLWWLEGAIVEDRNVMSSVPEHFFLVFCQNMTLNLQLPK